MDRLLEHCIEYIKQFDKVAVAYSGGVDSALLAYLAHQSLGENAHIYTITTPYTSKAELKRACSFAKTHKFNHNIISIETPESIQNNPKERCYHCKKELFTTLKKEALSQNIHTILEGSNSNDTQDYRPGMKALSELEIVSPFLTLNIDKNHIRSFSKELHLNSWNIPSNPCLLTRLPYNKIIDSVVLKQVEAAEDFLAQKGITSSRVRHEGRTARIELSESDRIKINQLPLAKEVVDAFNQMGFTFVSVDLKPFVSGNMNQTLQVN